MTSCLWLERPGAWRVVGVTFIFALALLPSVPLFWQAAGTGEAASLGSVFAQAVQNSLVVGLVVGGIGVVLGLPTGVLCALYEFPGRRSLLALALLPILVPSFLWAIGWSSLAGRIGPAATSAISGRTGCVLVFLAEVVPLVLVSTFAATRAVSASQLDAARLAGGEKTVIRYACGSAAVSAVLAAALGAVLTLSDPGPGQILGLRTAASEVLCSFSALYDFALAGRQCAALSLLVLLLALPLAWLAAPRISAQLLAKQSCRTVPVRHPDGVWITAGVTLLVLSMLVPVTGLLLPLLDGTDFRRAASEVTRTGADTLLYAGGAGLVATCLGILLAVFVGRGNRLRAAVLVICLVAFALPPALGSLGMLHLATIAPAWTDPLLRSRATVCLVLGLHYLPVAVVIAMRAWQTMSASWAQAAAILGIPLYRYLDKVIIPFLLPAATAAMALVALLATADVGTVLLVHPPGKASLPLAIFTVMANAPESLVASLCLLYLAMATGLLVIAWTITGRRST